MAPLQAESLPCIPRISLSRLSFDSDNCRTLVRKASTSSLPPCVSPMPCPSWESSFSLSLSINFCSWSGYVSNFGAERNSGFVECEFVANSWAGLPALRKFLSLSESNEVIGTDPLDASLVMENAASEGQALDCDKEAAGSDKEVDVLEYL